MQLLVDFSLVFRNGNKLNCIHVFLPPFEGGVLNFMHVNLNLTDELFSVMDLLWQLGCFLRLHYFGVDISRCWMLPDLNPWLLLLWELPTPDLGNRVMLFFFNSKHLLESALRIRFTCTTTSRRGFDKWKYGWNKLERHGIQYAAFPPWNHLCFLIDFSITLFMCTDKFNPFSCIFCKACFSVAPLMAQKSVHRLGILNGVQSFEGQGLSGQSLHNKEIILIFY